MNELIKVGNIKDRIFELRGHKVILDSDLATLYGVSTKNLNKAVKRNIDRFPLDFMFQLTSEEVEILRFQIGTTNMAMEQEKLRCQIGTTKISMRRALPYAFTRNGVNMLASVLRSKIAVQRSIFIMRAFSALEEAIGKRKKDMLSSPDVIKELSVHSKAIMRLFQEIKVKDKQIVNIDRLQKDMARLIQKIIIASIE